MTQETKVSKLTREVACVPGYESFWSCSAKPGYSGVATFVSSPPFSPVDAAVDCLPGDCTDLNTEGRYASCCCSYLYVTQCTGLCRWTWVVW